MNLPRTAIVLVYETDRTAFLKRLYRLDQIVSLQQATFYIVNTCVIEAEQLRRDDLRQVITPVEAIQTTAESLPAALLAGFASVPAEFKWVWYIKDGNLKHEWVDNVARILENNRNIGVWENKNLFMIKRDVYLQLSGIETRYLRGDYIFRDLCWQAKQSGIGVGALPDLSEGVSSYSGNRMSSSTAIYYHVRNTFLFARLRLSSSGKFIAIARMLKKSLIRRFILTKSFWQGLRDGWKIMMAKS